MFKHGIPKKEYMANRMNRAKAIKAQFPDRTKLEDGRNRYFMKDGMLEGRE